VRNAQRYVSPLLEEAGWRLGTSLENGVAWQLHRFKFRVAQARDRDSLAVHQQYRLGRYRVDFAWPLLKIALEADGWWHRSPDGAAKDAERDAWMRDQDWIVFRVHDNAETLADQLCRVARIVRSLAEHGPGLRDYSPCAAKSAKARRRNAC
jgi:very-short-patch-repair endonuclease